MKYRMHFAKTPEITQQEGILTMPEIEDKLKESFPEGKASLSDIKKTLSPGLFQRFCELQNIEYIGAVYYE